MICALLAGIALVPATYHPPNAWPVLGDRRVERALCIAARVFPFACGGQLRPTPTVIRADIGAKGRGDAASCTIWIDSAYLARSGSARVCDTVLHEYGHLAGLDHSDNPRSVMYWKARAQPDRRCQ